uniref:Protein kinase domain-containing protein n=1 Tax=Steinernema glaseri TaxID=37863 RepID=A0A1I7YNU1_9BILA
MEQMNNFLGLCNRKEELYVAQYVPRQLETPSVIKLDGSFYYPSHKLGSGGFGTVFAMVNSSGEKIAVKTVNDNGNDTIALVNDEVTIWSRLRHKNIVQFYAYHTLPGVHFISMELAAYGDLENFITEQSYHCSPSLRRHIASSFWKPSPSSIGTDLCIAT